MRIDVFSIFPQMVSDFASHSLVGKAITNELCQLNTWDLRDYTTDRHRSVDDTPFGGGAGMVMTPQPIFDAVAAVDPPRPLYLLAPGGDRFDQPMAEDLAAGGGFSLLCGRYEGVDQRVTDELCDGEISIGDYVLSGGEVAALTIIEAVVRLVPGVMGNSHSGVEESFSSGLLEYPQYTRPATFEGIEVPDVLTSGDHGKVERWRRCQALLKTHRVRPDILLSRGVTPDDLRNVSEFAPDQLGVFEAYV